MISICVHIVFEWHRPRNETNEVMRHVIGPTEGLQVPFGQFARKLSGCEKWESHASMMSLYDRHDETAKTQGKHSCS